MKQTVTIYCKNNGQQKDFPFGTTLREIYETLGLKLPNAVANARVNNRSEGLGFRVFNNKDVEFQDVSTHSGMRTYVRSLCFVLCKAVHDLYPEGKILLEHPVSNGYYGTLELGHPTSLDDIEAIKRRMAQLIAENHFIRRVECRTEEAVELFRRQKMEDKIQLLETYGSIYTTYYRLGDDDYVDYFYGPMLQTTGELYLFDLVRYYDGFLLRVPTMHDPHKLGEIVKQEKMWNAFREYLSWQKIMNLSNVGDLNLFCQAGHAKQLVYIAEALQEKRIVQIADAISRRVEGDTPLRVILISGPSSSGKTTFSKRLSVQLLANGLKPYPISLDNYFVERERTPRNAAGDYDYESLYALDLELFNSHLRDLLDGKTVALPTYNFVSGQREYRGETLQLSDKMVLILEGIHALNPELTPRIPDAQKFKIYVSALTTMSLDDHNWIPTTDTRLLRRIIRDYNYRGCSALDTIARWPDVRAGEEKWIFPYQENADVMFNSALLFEFAVLRRHAEPMLMTVPQNRPQYAEAARLLTFLHYFVPIEEHELPRTSLMREFVGGSAFDY